MTEEPILPRTVAFQFAHPDDYEACPTNQGGSKAPGHEACAPDATHPFEGHRVVTVATNANCLCGDPRSGVARADCCAPYAAECQAAFADRQAWLAANPNAVITR